MENNLISIKDLVVEYKTKRNVFGGEKITHALNCISVDIKENEVFAIAGESGCGKSTLAKTIMKLIPAKSGKIIINDEDILQKNIDKDFYQISQLIFQNPYSSLNPKMKIGEILKEPLDINKKHLSECEKIEIIKEKLSQVGLDSSCLDLYPHEFSGGQRQRIAIARALILDPKFIIADEPVSALDVSIQSQIINLLKNLQAELNITFLFISHDLSVIRYISNRVAIMYLGEIVELGTTEEVFKQPKHPYTRALLNSVPKIDGDETKELITLKGELPSPENLPKGCKFHTRCPYAFDKCKTDMPTRVDITQTHYCNCFLYQETLTIS